MAVEGEATLYYEGISGNTTRNIIVDKILEVGIVAIPTVDSPNVVVVPWHRVVTLIIPGSGDLYNQLK